VTANSGRDAVDNARMVDRYETGMCLKYVRAEAWEIGSLYGDAIDAWYGAVDRHPGDRTPPLGAPMFYEGGNHGHIVLCVKSDADEMRSTDMPNSGVVSENDVDWPVRNWGVTYLGWTGDLNSVDLPLDGIEDDMDLQDKMDEWSPADGTSKEKVTVGYTLRQARGYAEDAYQRIGKLDEKVAALQADINKILNKLG
jgi:hypothetical protein